MRAKIVCSNGGKEGNISGKVARRTVTDKNLLLPWALVLVVGSVDNVERERERERLLACSQTLDYRAIVEDSDGRV